MSDPASIEDIVTRATSAMSDEALTDAVADAYLRGQDLCAAKLANFMLATSFATGHGEGFDSLLHELEWQVRELRGAIRKEGKADCRMCAGFGYYMDSLGSRPCPCTRI